MIINIVYLYSMFRHIFTAEWVVYMYGFSSSVQVIQNYGLNPVTVVHVRMYAHVHNFMVITLSLRYIKSAVVVN